MARGAVHASIWNYKLENKLDLGPRLQYFLLYCPSTSGITRYYNNNAELLLYFRGTNSNQVNSNGSRSLSEENQNECHYHVIWMFLNSCHIPFLSMPFLVTNNFWTKMRERHKSRPKLYWFTRNIVFNFMKCFAPAPYKVSIKCIPGGLIDNKSELIRVIAWRWIDNKPLPGPMMTKTFNAIWHHQAPMS